MIHTSRVSSWVTCLVGHSTSTLRCTAAESSRHKYIRVNICIYEYMYVCKSIFPRMHAHSRTCTPARKPHPSHMLTSVLAQILCVFVFVCVCMCVCVLAHILGPEYT